MNLFIFYGKEQPIEVLSERCTSLCIFVILFVLITLGFMYTFSTMEPDKLFMVATSFSEREMTDAPAMF